METKQVSNEGSKQERSIYMSFEKGLSYNNLIKVKQLTLCIYTTQFILKAISDVFKSWLILNS